MEAVSVKKRSVQFCDVPDLFRRLCRSVVTHWLSQKWSVLDLRYQDRAKQAFLQEEDRLQQLVRRLVLLSMDVVLLRKWEWMGTDTGCVSHSLGVALSLHCQGQSGKAERLANAIHWLVGGMADLVEPESVLQFLFLLSCVGSSGDQLDAHTTSWGDQTYSYYPSAVFEQPLDPTDSAIEARVNSAYELFTGVPGSRFTTFIARVIPEDTVLKKTLFGALTHATSTDLNDPLGLPYLPSDHTNLSLLPKVDPATPVHSPLLSPPPTGNHGDQDSLFALAASSEEATLLRSWEGWSMSTPFLCDAEPPAPAIATALLASDYARLAGISSPPPPHSLLLPQLLQDTVDGLPHPPLQPVMGTDAVLFSVAHCLNALLISCRATLHSASPLPSLLQREQTTHHILPVTRFVVDLLQKGSLVEKFDVMDSLFGQCCQLQATPHYILFLSILSQALLNYLKIVEQWVFCGDLDTNQWIGIQANADALEKRDDSYWTSGYTAPNGCSPQFLSHLSQPILTCGKSLNLLRLCQPQHPLCNGQFPWPGLKLAYTSRQLKEVEVHWQAYRSEVTSCCLAMSEQSRLQRIAKEERQQSAVIQARQEARREGERIRELEKEQVMASALRKRSLALDLQDQIETRRVHRSQQLEEERRADKDLMATYVQEEHALSKKQALLELEARQDLELHYQQLANEAEQRRARAQWRLARLKLSAAREALWKEERVRWRQERVESKEVGEDKVEEKRGRGEDNGLGAKTKESRESKRDRVDVKGEDLGGRMKVDKDGEMGVEVGGDRFEEPSRTESGEVEDSGDGTGGGVVVIPEECHREGVNIDGIMGPTSFPPSCDRDSGWELHIPAVEVPHKMTPPGLVAQQDMGDPRLVSSRGHAPQDTTDLHTVMSLGHQDAGDPRLVSSRGHAPQDTTDLHTVMSLGHQDAGDPHLVSSRGHAPQDITDLHTVMSLGHQDAGDPRLVSSRGHAPQDVANLHTVMSVGHQDAGDPRLVSSRGHAPQDTANLHSVMSLGHQDAGDPRLVSSRGHAPQDTTNLHIVMSLGHQDAGDPRLVSSRGHAPQDTANLHTVMSLGHQDAGDPRLVSSRGHAPPTTIERYLGDAGSASSTAIRDAGYSSRGHTPPATLQRLLLEEDRMEEGDRVEETGVAKGGIDMATAEEGTLMEMAEQGVLVHTACCKFMDDFSILDAEHLHDVLGKILKDCSVSAADLDLDFLSLFPLPSLLAHSIDTPLLTQCSLVNQSFLDYLVSHCQLHHHLLTLKRFLLLEDGEFGHTLSTRLFEQLSYGRDWHTLCSPSFLNSVLHTALESSLLRHSVHSAKLSFSLKYQPHTIHTNAIKALDYLELRYKVEWPCNIVITASSMHRYNKILQLLLEMKRSSWLLKQTFHCLKDCQILDELKIRELQTYRHEFQHFVNIMHGYVSSQLFGVTWEEFQTELTQHSHSLDDIIQAHTKFIDRALFRCLLSKKARPVMNLIYDLLTSILTFSSQISIGVGGGFTPQQYASTCSTCKGFRTTVRLLINVLAKLIARGYQPHLEELLLRLNFNSFY